MHAEQSPAATRSAPAAQTDNPVLTRVWRGSHVESQHRGVWALVDSAGFDAEAIAKGIELSEYDLQPGDLTELKRLFEHATTFGSLIQVPEGLAERLPALRQLSEATSRDMFVSDALKRLGPLVQQARMCLSVEQESIRRTTVRRVPVSTST